MAAPFDTIPDGILSDIFERAVITAFPNYNSQAEGRRTLARLSEVCQRFNVLLRATTFLAWSYGVDGKSLCSFLLRRPPIQLRTVALDFKHAKNELIYDFYAPFLSMLFMSPQQCIKKLCLTGVALRLKDNRCTPRRALENLIGSLSMCPLLESLQLCIRWPGLTGEGNDFPEGVVFVGGSFQCLKSLDVSCEFFSVEDFEKRFPKLEELRVHGNLEGGEALVSETLTRFRWDQDTRGHDSILQLRGPKLLVVVVDSWYFWALGTRFLLELECPLLKTLKVRAHPWHLKTRPTDWIELAILHTPMLRHLDVASLPWETVNTILSSIGGASRITIHPTLVPEFTAWSAKHPKVKSYETLVSVSR